MPNPARPLVTIVIPVFNGEATLADCLHSILRTDYPPDRREVVVVDNGSTDGTPEIIRRLPVRSVREPRRGAPAARNRGISAGHGDIVAFCDADCVASRGWLRELAAAFVPEDVGGVAGEIVAFPPRTAAERYAAAVRHLSPQRYLARPLLPFAVFANLAFRRQVFDRIGLLDEALFQGDSTDFCTRFLRGTNLRLRHAPKAVVFHRHRMTTWQFARQQWAYGRGHALLYIKYRREIPWGWRRSLLAYQDLARSGGLLIGCSLAYAAGRGRAEDVSHARFDLLKKIAERLGFIRQSLAGGYLHL